MYVLRGERGPRYKGRNILLLICRLNALPILPTVCGAFTVALLATQTKGYFNSMESVMKNQSSCFKRAFCIYVLTLLSISYACAQGSLPTHHVHSVVTNGKAVLVGPLSPTQHMQLAITLPLRNQQQLTNLLTQLRDPSSPNYRHFLSVDQFAARFGASAADYAAVVHFAESNGLTVTKAIRNYQFLIASGSVAQVEKAFHISMNVYQHPTEKRTFFSLDREPTVDSSVPIWHITGFDDYSIPRPTLVSRPSTASHGGTPTATTGSGPSASFLGSDMRAAYYGGTALTGSGQSLGLLEYYGTDLDDLTAYFTNVGQTNSVPITLLSTDGTSTSCLYADGCDDTEQTLDMTQAIGMAPGLSSLVMYVGSTDSAIFNAMATASPLNAQLSISWVWSPSSPDADDPYFEEFAAQGQNVFAAAGDWGAWDVESEPDFPSADPYVTSVGGTDLDTTSASGSWSSETAWSSTGGGISQEEYAIPSWQTTAAAGCTSCSQSYRNGPDISANANWSFYTCSDQGQNLNFSGAECGANVYGGTSFAAPMWAGFLALANQQYFAANSTTLPFINPAIYAIGEGPDYNSDFHDIVSGSNGTYSATTGYDLVTGWGSPNGQSLINDLTGSTSAGSIVISPSSVSFTKAIGQVSTGQTITVTNETGANFTNFALTNSNSTNFLVTSNTCSSSLSNGASCSFNLACQPYTISTINATIVATGGSSFSTTLPMSCTGTAAGGILSSSTSRGSLPGSPCSQEMTYYAWTYTDTSGVAHAFAGNSEVITLAGPGCRGGGSSLLDEWSIDGEYYLQATGPSGTITAYR